ncbi:hypothetical protein C8K30_101919 [Promicromonospora sp. AC04]|nr:hypothetical protein C8K30_101919 [Promicromonospora sp. AC04]
MRVVRGEFLEVGRGFTRSADGARAWRTGESPEGGLAC